MISGVQSALNTFGAHDVGFNPFITEADII